LRQRLIVGHDIEIVVRFDCKQCQQIVEHLPVLRGDAHDVVDVRVHGEACTTGAILMVSDAFQTPSSL